MTAGQTHDRQIADRLLDDLGPRIIVLADKAYDADRIRELVQNQDATPTFLPKSNRKWKPCFRKRLYRERNLIERFLSKLKHVRRVATRYDKLDAIFPRWSSSPQSGLGCVLIALGLVSRRRGVSDRNGPGLPAVHDGAVPFLPFARQRLFDAIKAVLVACMWWEGRNAEPTAVSSTVSRCRPPKRLGCTAMMPARRSRPASATSRPPRPATCSMLWSVRSASRDCDGAPFIYRAMRERIFLSRLHIRR